MDGLCKALLTAAAVLLVMTAARRVGHRLAGVVAALPIITAPTLAWLAHEESVTFAVSAAVGSIAACGMLAVFALGYARAARYGGVAVALGCGLAGAVAMALPAEAASANLNCALALATGTCAMAFLAMPKSATQAATGRRRHRGSPWVVAAAAGGLTALAGSMGPSLGGFATGLLSSLPLVTGAVAMAEHAASGHLAASHFLRGYVTGLFGKAAFGAVFALLAPQTGAVVALALACACACLMSLSRGRPAELVNRDAAG